MPNIELLHHFRLSNDSDLKGGDEFVRLDIPVTNGEGYYTKHTIADAYGKDVIWSAGGGGKDTVDKLIILSDSDNVWLEFRDDNSSPVFRLVELAKNWPFLWNGPYMGSGTSTTFDAGVLVDNTDHDTVDQIEAMNNVANGVGDAVVKVWIVE